MLFSRWSSEPLIAPPCLGRVQEEGGAIDREDGVLGALDGATHLRFAIQPPDATRDEFSLVQNASAPSRLAPLEADVSDAERSSYFQSPARIACVQPDAGRKITTACETFMAPEFQGAGRIEDQGGVEADVADVFGKKDTTRVGNLVRMFEDVAQAPGPVVGIARHQDDGSEVRAEAEGAVAIVDHEGQAEGGLDAPEGTRVADEELGFGFARGKRNGRGRGGKSRVDRLDRELERSAEIGFTLDPHTKLCLSPPGDHQGLEVDEVGEALVADLDSLPLIRFEVDVRAAKIRNVIGVVVGDECRRTNLVGPGPDQREIGRPVQKVLLFLGDVEQDRAGKVLGQAEDHDLEGGVGSARIRDAARPTLAPVFRRRKLPAVLAAAEDQQDGKEDSELPLHEQFSLLRDERSWSMSASSPREDR